MLDGMLDMPFAMAASMISTPPMIENILINDVGVSLPKELNALSMSNALTMNAPPRIASTIAVIHFASVEYDGKCSCCLAECRGRLERTLNTGNHKRAS